MEPRIGIARFCTSLSTTFVWAAANGCLWQRTATRHTLARDGRLEVLRWARKVRVPVACVDLCTSRCERSPACVEVGAGARLSVECEDVYDWLPGAGT
jgi:hypothetical protein